MKEIDLTTAIGATIVVFFLILFIVGIYIFFDGYTMTEICASNEVRFSNMFCQIQQDETMDKIDFFILGFSIGMFLYLIFCRWRLYNHKPSEAKKRC